MSCFLYPSSSCCNDETRARVAQDHRRRELGCFCPGKESNASLFMMIMTRKTMPTPISDCTLIRPLSIDLKKEDKSTSTSRATEQEQDQDQEQEQEQEQERAREQQSNRARARPRPRPRARAREQESKRATEQECKRATEQKSRSKSKCRIPVLLRRIG